MNTGNKSLNFLVRQATLKDFSAIQALNAKSFLLAHKQRHEDALDLDYPFSGKGIAYYKDALTSPKKVAFVAEETPVGIIGYVIGSTFNKFEYRKILTGELENLFVEDYARRRGVGKLLVHNLLEWFKQHGVASIIVSVYAKNFGPIKFYKSLGFSPWSVTLEYRLL